MLDLTTVLLFIVVLLVTAWFLSRRSYANLPPGPPAWPIIGNLWGIQQNTKYYLELNDYAKHFGEIFSLRYGSRPVVVLNSSKIIREAFVTKADYFSNRPDNLYMLKVLTSNAGIIFNPHEWKDLRKFVLVALKDFGLGKSSLEERCKEESEALVAAIDDMGGNQFNCALLLQNAVSNIICSVAFGQRFLYDDKEFKKLIKGMTILFQSNNLLETANFIPWVLPFTLLMNVLPFRDKTSLQFIMFIKEFIYGKIKDHRETYDPEQIRDFLDLYIQSEKDGKISETDALRIIIDLFFAGTETTSTSLQWMILYMIHYPEIQRKCRQEIHDVLGTSRAPTTKDRASLVYTDAMLKELLRITSIAPVGIPHTTTEDVELGGYTIPKGAHVLANIYSAQMDPAVWEEPEKFSPERWIDAEGKLVNHSAYMPFSVGRRVCLGEQLAKLELFIFGVSLLQRFEFEQGDEMPPMEGVQSVTLVPKPFLFRAVKT